MKKTEKKHEKLHSMQRFNWFVNWFVYWFVYWFVNWFVLFSEYKECNVGNLEYLRVGLTNGFASSFRSPARAGSIGHQPHTPVSTGTFKYKDDAEIIAYNSRF